MQMKRKSFGLKKGFNRNIVECKCETFDINATPYMGFNRNIVECKFRIY